MKEKFKFSANDGNEHSVVEMEEIEVKDLSKTPMAGSYPCTHSGCNCSDFVMKTSIQPSSIICGNCGHGSSEHGLP